MERFILRKSALTLNGWVLEDTENSIVCSFEVHKFNETQEFDVRSALGAQELATIMREIGDWMRENAYFIAMPLRDENDINAYIGEQVRCARLAKGWSKYRLALFRYSHASAEEFVCRFFLKNKVHNSVTV